MRLYETADHKPRKRKTNHRAHFSAATTTEAAAAVPLCCDFCGRFPRRKGKERQKRPIYSRFCPTSFSFRPTSFQFLPTESPPPSHFFSVQRYNPLTINNKAKILRMAQNEAQQTQRAGVRFSRSPRLNNSP